MTCPSCNNQGVFVVRYHDGSPTDWAVCLCPAASDFRRDQNNGKQHVPAYQVWAIRHGIDPEHVAPMEALLTDEELAARGFSEVSAPTAIDAIAAAARNRAKHVR
jgi:hypothetical protein